MTAPTFGEVIGGREPAPAATVTCPACNGTGGKDAIAIICRLNGELRIGSCRPCEGIGRVDPERAAIMELGERWRQVRVRSGISLDAMARSLAVTPRELGDFEHGRSVEVPAWARERQP